MNSVPVRTGFGYDVHRLVAGRPLILGGVTIPYEYGLLGHSDADVLTHALCDALLGAAALGDIGHHFPDDDPGYFGVSSIELLEEVAGKLAATGWILGNADVCLVAQAPRISPYVPQMTENLTRACGSPPGSINVKATTTEGLGFAGTGKGIAAYATALIIKKDTHLW
jgi:2-C-methyl-D-erythritol 2,4-cyclodiphosphate synthase